jgi:cell division protein FtsN
MMRTCTVALLFWGVFLGCSEEGSGPPDDSGENATSVKVSAPVDSLMITPTENDSVTTSQSPVDSASLVAGGEGPTRHTNFSPTGRYILQVGAYRNRASADDAAVDLKLMGYPAQVVAVGAMFRVRIGFFDKVGDAKELGEQLNSEVGLRYWVDNR